MKHRIVYKASIISLALSFLGVGYMAYLAAWPFQTISVQEPIHVLNTPVHAGDVVHYEIKECRYTTRPAYITRTLVGKIGLESVTIPLGSSTSQRPKGCADIIAVNVLIPIATPSGTYHILIGANFQLNPLRNISKSFTTVDFQIVNNNPAVDSSFSQAAQEASNEVGVSSVITPPPATKTAPASTPQPTPAPTPILSPPGILPSLGKQLRTILSPIGL